MPIQPVAKIWMDGELVDWQDANVHILTHGLHYGSGAFEGVRAYETSKGPGIFRLTDHIRRLFRSCAIYQMEIPYSIDELVEATKAVVRANEQTECYIRPLVYRGYGEMGLNPSFAPVNVAIASWAWGPYLGEEALTRGARLKISTWRRHDPNITPPAAKATGQYLNSGLAKVEAIKGGYDEALMLSHDGYVADATGENIFVITGGVLYTPPEENGALLGITRDSIMTIARDLGYTVLEKTMVRSDLYVADEAFLTGTAAEVCPVSEVDDRPLTTHGRGPITKEIQEIYFAAIRGKIAKYEPWVEYV